MTYFRPFKGAKWRRYDGDPSWVTAYDGFREALDGDDDYDDDGDVANCGLTNL